MTKIFLEISGVVNKKIINMTIGVAISFFALYIFGSFGQIKAYSDPLNIPTIKLLIINSLLFLTMSFAVYALIQEFLKFRLKLNIILISMLIISFFLSYQLITITDDKVGAVGFGYILIGDYLRDIHSINIYFMDWGGWATTMILYLTSIFSALMLEGFKKMKIKSKN